MSVSVEDVLSELSASASTSTRGLALSVLVSDPEESPVLAALTSALTRVPVDPSPVVPELAALASAAMRGA